MASQSELTKLIASASLFFPNFTMKPGMPEAYQMVLYDIPLDALSAGLKIYLSENQAFFPSAGQWRERSMSIVTSKREYPSEYEAWQEAIEHCRRGHYQDYSHPLIEKAVKIIGIEYWRNMLVDDEMPTRAHFFKVYQSLINRQMEDITMLPDVREVNNHYAQLNAGNMIKQLADKMRVG